MGAWVKVVLRVLNGVVRAPGEWGVFLHEANQGDDNVGEPHNESAIEVGKPQEHLNCLELVRVSQMLTGWSWPSPWRCQWG